MVTVYDEQDRAISQFKNLVVNDINLVDIIYGYDFNEIFPTVRFNNEYEKIENVLFRISNFSNFEQKVGAFVTRLKSSGLVSKNFNVYFSHENGNDVYFKETEIETLKRVVDKIKTEHGIEMLFPSTDKYNGSSALTYVDELFLVNKRLVGDINKIVRTNDVLKFAINEINNEKHGLSPYEKFLCAHSFVASFPYSEAKSGDSLIEPRCLMGALDSNVIVCVGQAKMLKAILNEAGIKIYNEMVRLKPTKNINVTNIPLDPEGYAIHYWTVVKLVDPKYKINSVFVNNVTHSEFNTAKRIDTYHKSFLHHAMTKNSMFEVDSMYEGYEFDFTKPGNEAVNVLKNVTNKMSRYEKIKTMNENFDFVSARIRQQLILKNSGVFENLVTIDPDIIPDLQYGLKNELNLALRNRREMSDYELETVEALTYMCVNNEKIISETMKSAKHIPFETFEKAFRNSSKVMYSSIANNPEKFNGVVDTVLMGNVLENKFYKNISKKNTFGEVNFWKYYDKYYKKHGNKYLSISYKGGVIDESIIEKNLGNSLEKTK